MANGTTDYSLGEISARMKNVEKKVDVLAEVQKKQQSIIDKGIGVLILIGFVAFSLYYLLQILQNL